jgi:lysyl-tRNA synthetase class 2
VWVPRFVCFRSAVDLPSVSLAALRAEAFLVAPAWWRNLGRRDRHAEPAPDCAVPAA